MTRPMVHLLRFASALTLLAAACAPAAPTSGASGGAAGAQAQAGGAQGRGAGGAGGANLRRPGGPGTGQGPGNLTRVSGTVQIVLPEGVWLTDGKNFGMTPATRITRGVVKQASDLRSGEFVNITSERQADGTLLAKEVNLLPGGPGGQQRLGGQNAQAQGQQGASGANTQRRPQGQGSAAQGQPATGQQRPQGQQGAANQAPSGGAARGPQAQQAERTLPDGSVVVMGAIESVDAGVLTVTAGSTKATVALNASTAVLQREAAEASELMAGATVTALLSDGDAVMVNLQ